MRGPGFQTEHVNGGGGGGDFLWNWGNLSRLVNFFWMSCKNNLAIFIWGHAQSINSLTVAMSCLTIKHDIATLTLLPLSSIFSSGFHPIFTIDGMQKWEHRGKGKSFLFEVNRASYYIVSYFLKLGIWLWTECVCLCIPNIGLLLLTCFCSWVL